MAPDVEELIKRVNTLTLDKNRLKQKLTQLTNGKDSTAKGSHSKPASFSFESGDGAATKNQDYNTASGGATTNNNKSSSSTHETASPNNRTNFIAGVECSTSCEEDILYMNELYRKRLDEYDEKWDLMQSKCSALMSELNALQAHFIRMKRENLKLEEKYRSQCDETDKIKAELQTVVLNYETQLSALSEHLSSIARQKSLEDEGAPVRSMRNPNYID